MRTDVELLQSWRDGETAAGDELFQRHFDALNRFFRSKLPGDARDLIQATWLTCVNKRDRIADQSFRAYLFGVARLELFASLRKRRRDSAFDATVTSLEALTGGPSRAAADKQQSKQLLVALSRLPLDLQILLELHYWEKLTTQEVASVLEIPVGTVRGRLQRARAQLGDLMKTDDVVKEAAAAFTDDLSPPSKRKGDSQDRPD